jgi:formylglycine-generating enzyme
MRCLALLPLLLLTQPADARRKTVPEPVVSKVPSIEEVVAKEGFTPTLSQSDVYKPGAVLVPNDRGGHDVVVSDCIGVEPEIAIMSASSIATTLSGGVSARLGAARGAVSAGVEKRLSFVDPEQRTISLGRLEATEACAKEVKTAARFKDLSEAIVLHDVLVAIIKNTVCTKADASGGVVMLGEAEAAAYSECVRESNAQVPLGYKAVALTQVLSVATTPAPLPVVPGTPAAASASVDFGTSGGLGIDAQLAEQACVQDAQAKGASARASRLSSAEGEARAKASAAWGSLAGDLEKCTKLKLAQRGKCVTAAEQWLTQARAMPVSIPAGVEPVETACGLKQPVFAANSRVVAAAEVSAAEAMVVRLQATDGVAVGKAGIEWVNLGRFSISKTEVTFGQYKGCVDAGACAPAHTSDGLCWLKDGASRKKGNLPSNFQGADQPAVCVDWNQASAFAKWAGGRLPTGEEWTYAATSGGQSWAYPWGDEKATCRRAVRYSGGGGCRQERTWPVCSKPEGNSTHGVCDLAGNVWEWTQETEGASRVGRRGGGWNGTESSMRALSRLNGSTSDRYDNLGFRLAR